MLGARTGNRKFPAASQLALELYLSIREMAETREHTQEQEQTQARLAALAARSSQSFLQD